VGAGPCRIPAPNPCLNRGSINLNAAGLDRTFSGFRSRANLSLKVTEDALLYYTWSQGFRAGGFNRPPSAIAYLSVLSANGLPGQELADKHGGWQQPASYAPDNLTNNEVGWKTSWLGKRLQWDGAIYQEDWSHAQIAIYDSGVLSIGAILNGGNYRVRGVETSGVARIAGGLTVEAAAAWNHSELVEQAPFVWKDGTPIDFGALHLSNPGGALGSPLAGSPSFQGNLRARDEFAFNGYHAFVQIGAVHRAHSLSTTDRLTLDVQGNSIAYDLPPFTTYDAALGVGKDGWLLQLYGENLTDTRAELYANYAQYYKAITVSRPRTFGLRCSYKFSAR
jgi:outer membrane receptor protein involved in Fe transport